MIRVTAFGQFQNELKETYIERIKRHIPFQWTDISIKHSPKKQQKILPEEESFLEKYAQFSALNVGGKPMNSEEFYRWCFAGPDRHLVIGPPNGFSDLVLKRANSQISLSPLTFTHGLSQIVLAESLYRAICQLQNHPFVK